MHPVGCLPRGNYNGSMMTKNYFDYFSIVWHANTLKKVKEEKKNVSKTIHINPDGTLSHPGHSGFFAAAA